MAFRNITLLLILLSVVLLGDSNYLPRSPANEANITPEMRTQAEKFVSEILYWLRVDLVLARRIGVSNLLDVPPLRWSYINLPGVTMYIPTFGNGTLPTDDLLFLRDIPLKITINDGIVSLSQSLRTKLVFDYQFKLKPIDQRPTCGGNVRENVENFQVFLTIAIDSDRTCSLADIDVSTDGRFHSGKLSYNFTKICYKYRPPLVQEPIDSFKLVDRSMRTLMVEDRLKLFLKEKVESIIEGSNYLKSLIERLCLERKRVPEIVWPTPDVMPIPDDIVYEVTDDDY